VARPPPPGGAAPSPPPAAPQARGPLPPGTRPRGRRGRGARARDEGARRPAGPLFTLAPRPAPTFCNRDHPLSHPRLRKPSPERHNAGGHAAVGPGAAAGARRRPAGRRFRPLMRLHAIRIAGRAHAQNAAGPPLTGLPLAVAMPSQTRPGEGPRRGPHGGRQQVRPPAMGPGRGGARGGSHWRTDLSRACRQPARTRPGPGPPGAANGAPPRGKLHQRGRREWRHGRRGAAAPAPRPPRASRRTRRRRAPRTPPPSPPALPPPRRTHVSVRAAKELHFNKNMEALKKMQAGADKLATVVGVTLGPKVRGRGLWGGGRVRWRQGEGHSRQRLAAALEGSCWLLGAGRAPSAGLGASPTRRGPCPALRCLPPAPRPHRAAPPPPPDCAPARAATWCWSPSTAPPRS
jgi:hypothetical protein